MMTLEQQIAVCKEFEKEMEARLEAVKDLPGKQGWDNDGVEVLMQRLENKLAQIKAEPAGSYGLFGKYGDLANYAMMLWDKNRSGRV